MYSDSVRNTEQVTKQQRANPPMGEVSMRQIKGLKESHVVFGGLALKTQSMGMF